MIRFVMCVVLGVLASIAGPSTLLSQGGMPRLERVSMPLLDSVGPEKANATVAISMSGTLAFTGAFDERNRLVTLVSGAGKTVVRFGVPGSGPGELSLPLQMSFGTTELVIAEASRRISRFGLDGSFRDTRAMTTPMFLAAGAGDSLDVLQIPSGSQPVLDFYRISPQSMSGRLLMSGQSPNLRELSSEGQQQGAFVASIVYAAVGREVVAANVATYRMLGFGQDASVRFDVRGKSNAPPGETALMAVGGLQVDGQKRLWAIGVDRITERSFADLYRGPQLLGRLDLACRGSVVLSGVWMAILCATPDTSNRDVVLRVYRIVEAR